MSGFLRLAVLIAIGASQGVAQVPPAQVSGAASISTGQIKGWVLGTNGKPVAGVAVLINSRPRAKDSLTPFNSSAVTGSDGSFAVPAVPDGSYSVCPHPRSAAELPPCSWSTEPRVVVTSAQTVFLPPIQMQAAVDFYVRVNDPNGTRAASEGKAPGAALMLAVRAPNGRMFPIPMVTKDSAGADHHLAVPAGVDLVFMAASQGLAATNSLGASISNQAGSSVTVNIPSGQTQHKEVINIP